MSKKEKLINKLKSDPRDFTFDDAVTLLGLLGFKKHNKGKTSGSRVKFAKEEDSIKIELHRSHPQKELKSYQVKQLIEQLTEEGLI